MHASEISIIHVVSIDTPEIVLRTQHAASQRPYLLHKVGKEGVRLVFNHPEAHILREHSEEQVQELEALEVDGGVCVKEPQCDPSQEEVQRPNGRVLVGGVA